MNNTKLDETTLINQFNQVKVYQVNATDSHIKKFDLKSMDGIVEIHMLNNENTNQVFIRVLSNTDSSLKDVYMEKSLNELDLNFMNYIRQINQNCFINRIELKSKKRARDSSKSKFYYAIEFFEESVYKQFQECVKCLNEMNSSPSELSDNDYDFEMLDVQKTNDSPTDSKIGDLKKLSLDDEENDKLMFELCDKLKESIEKGSKEEACSYVRKLADMRANLEIIPLILSSKQSINSKTNSNNTSSTKSDDETISEINACKLLIVIKKSVLATKRTYNNKRQRPRLGDNESESENDGLLELNIDKTKYCIKDLKKQVLESFSIPLDQQLVIVNDYNANDGSADALISKYSKSVSASANNRSTTSAQASSSSGNEGFEFEAVVFNMASKLPDVYEIDSDDDENHILEFFTKKPKPNDEKQKEDLERNFNQLAAYYNQEINENAESFDCDICLDDGIEAGKGVVLKECLHVFCKECLKSHINLNDDPIVKCPYSKDYNCDYNLQEREIRALLTDQDYKKYQMKCLRKSELTMQNVFHCKTNDCIGFCIFEDELNFFDCPVCEKVNCLRCNVTHMGKTCKEYQEDLKLADINDKNAQKNKEALDELIQKKKAMYCPGCKIILCKQEGCDWLLCAMCKMEICWATRGPRWGPKGRGDTTGGCKCNFATGKPCTPGCQNCH